MPAPIRKKMRRWHEQNGARPRRAPGLTVRDMTLPPEMCTSIRAGGSLWQAARRRMVRSARPRRPGAVAIAAGRKAPLGESAPGWATGPGLPGRPRLKVAPALPLKAVNGRHAKYASSIVNFEERAFRDALSVFPTGVAVVTALSDAGERLGLT